MPPELLEPMAQFGIAGLMSALWIWERTLSKRRENQLSEAHRQLISHHDALRVLVKLVRRNTQTIDRFEQTLSHAVNILELVRNDVENHAD